MTRVRAFRPWLVAAICGAVCCSGAWAKVAPAPEPSAKAGLLLDIGTGLVLWDKHPDERHFPASLTKMMTALLLLENSSADDVVQVSKRASEVGESSLDLVEGEQVQVRDLLCGILMKSANDASAAAAEHVSGTVEDFVTLMNARARQLGLSRTHFCNPHGLHDPNHYSTAADLAVLARYCMLRPDFAAIARQKRTQIPGADPDTVREVPNHNRLLGHYAGADGVKTGYTRQAGRCLAFSATRNKLHLLGVVLDCEDSYADARALLNWGFGNFERVPVVVAGVTESQVHVKDGKQPTVRAVAQETICTVLPKEAPRPIPRLLEDCPGAPVKLGQLVGSLAVTMPDGTERHSRLVAAEKVGRSFMAIVRDRAPGLLLVGCVVLLAMIASYAYGSSAKSARRRRARVPTSVRATYPGRPREG